MNNNSPFVPRWTLIAMFVAASVGVLDATYLTVTHYFGLSTVCLVFQNCEQVLTSPYSEIFGIPLAFFGAVYYALMLLLLIDHASSGRRLPLFTAAALSVCGFLTSMWLVYLQLFVIYAICLYCVISATMSTLLFICGFIVFHRWRQSDGAY